MQNCFGLLVSDVMPIYMIIPRYSHNYAKFCQLLSSNLFTHCRILMLLREATSETYGPRVSLSSYQSPLLYYCLLLLCFYFLLCIFISKIPKILYLSDLTLVSEREGLDNPFIALFARFLFVCVGAWNMSMISYWIDTLVLKN